MSALYLDTSSVLAILFREPGYEALLDRISKTERLITSRLLHVELERAILRRELDDPAFARLSGELRREIRDFYSRVDTIEIDNSVCDLAGRIFPNSRLRALDSIHLATFQILQSKLKKIEMLSLADQNLHNPCSISFQVRE